MEEGNSLLRKAIAADNTEGYVYSDRRCIPIGRRGSAESH